MVITISYDGKKMYTSNYRIFYHSNLGWTSGPYVGVASKASFSNDGLYLIINNDLIGGTIFAYKFDGTNWNLFQNISVVTWCGTGAFDIACSFRFITNTTFFIHYNNGKIFHFALNGNKFVLKTSTNFLDAAC